MNEIGRDHVVGEVVPEMVFQLGGGKLFLRSIIGDKVRVISLGVSVGVSLNPETPAEMIFDVLEEVDLVLVMSVHPGFGGQEFMPQVLEKVKTLSQRMRADQWLQIDGGIDQHTIGQAAAAGANCFVAGVAIFHPDDPAKAIQDMRATAQQCIV